MAVKSLDYRKLAKAAAEAALEKKAGHVVVLDIRKETDIVDYIVIAGADSSAQMKAVRASITEVLEGHGAYPVHQEGRATGRWIMYLPTI